MNVEEITIRKYKGYGSVLYSTRTEAEESFLEARLADAVFYNIEDIFERKKAARAAMFFKDRLLKILQEIK